MRNLKRALSLALASVMLLGMMVVGTSAVSTSGFTDADEISNTEAVDLATGLEIFAGYTDGSFGPAKAVTRAEAAVVIAKILHGSDVNPANFAGAGKFTDVDAWAEGYVNLVSSLGIIVGRGEGIFDPNATVTTVEFSTMLLKALGYYVAEDALAADWKLEVTSKANALGLYGDLELAMDAPLTRENVAVLTMNALFAQRVAYDDFRGLYVKANDRNVVVTNGTVDELNTLAQNTYGLYSVDGVVTANGGMDINMPGKTAVVFDEAKDVTGDAKVEEEYTFATETGLDLIGHAVTVYYTIEKKAPVVYAVVDNATLVVEASMSSHLTNLAKSKGFDRDTSETVCFMNYDIAAVVPHDDTEDVYGGSPVVMISNSADLTLDYVIVLDQGLDYITKVDVEDSDKDNIITMYTGAQNDYDDETNAIAIGEVEAEDYVVVTYVEATETYIIEAAPVEIAMLTEVDRELDTTKALYSEETKYSKNGDIEVYEEVLDEDNAYAITKYADVLVEGEYLLVFDLRGNLIGVAALEEDTVINVAYVAQFGYKINTAPSLNDKYALTAHVYFPDGTDAVHYVDNTDGVFEDVKVTSAGELKIGAEVVGTVAALNAAENGAGVAIRLYDVDVNSDGTIVIDELKDQETVAVDEVTQIKKGVTWMGETADKDVYGNSKSLFAFVYGAYADDTLIVGWETGMKNVPTIDLTEDAEVAQVVVTAKDSADYAIVDATLVANYEYDTSVSGIYYYDGQYTIKRIAAGEYTLTYKMYDIKTGELTPFTFDGYESDDEARDDAKDKEYGYYEDDAKDMKQVKIGEPEYVVRTAFEDYIDLGDTLTMYTAANAKGAGVTIDEDTIFVDLYNKGVEDLADVASLVKKNQATWDNAYKAGLIDSTPDIKATLSYVYTDDDNLVDIIFVIGVGSKYAGKDYADDAETAVKSAKIVDVTVQGMDITVEYTAGDDGVEPSLAAMVRAIKAEMGNDATNVVLYGDTAYITTVEGDEIAYIVTLVEAE